MKVCNICKESKPLSAFGIDKSRPDGLFYRCKPCHRVLVMGEVREDLKTGPKPQALEPRFWAKVKKTSGCWKWTGSKVSFGYGKILNNGQLIGAHRASWIIHFGNPPEGKSVLHKCDTPECTNPNHLFVGSQTDNMRDMLKKNRGRWRDKPGHKKR